MSVIKKTAITLIVNLLIIASFFVFVNCFGKQELWPVVVSGIFFIAFVVIKVSAINKQGSKSQQRYYH